MIAQARINGYGAAATTYRKAGWQGVLPLAPGVKWPPPEGYTGRQGGWPAGPQIIRWVTDNPAGGLALRLPRGVVGIDVDCYGAKQGDETLEALEQRYGPLPATWSSTSRGPGPSRILLFRVPDDLELPGTPGPSIEFIQFHHRYMVAWPSVVEGRLYLWYDPDGIVVHRPPRLEELPWLPEAWWAIKRPPRVAAATQLPRPVDGDWTQAVTRQHADGVAGLGQSGSRHDNVLPIIMALVRLDNLGHPGASEALDDLHARFVAAIGDRADLKAAEAEWRRMEDGAVDKVAATGATTPRYEDLKRPSTLPVLQDFPAPATAPTAATGAAQASTPADAADVAAAGVEEPLHGWEFVDLGPVLDGTYERPQPTLLRVRRRNG